MKTKSKILLLVSILLIAMCLFNANMVQATEGIADETKTTTTSENQNTPVAQETTKTVSDLTQEELNTIIPNEVEISTTKTEVADYFANVYNGADIENPVDIALSKKIVSIFNENGYTIEASKINSYMLTDAWENGYIEIIGKEIYKNFTIKYTKESGYNEQDATYIKNAVNSIKFANYEGDNAVFTMYNIGDEENASKWTENTYDFSKLLNDSSITVKKGMIAGGMGGATPWGVPLEIYFYKNGVLYETKNIWNLGAYGTTLENGTPVNMARLEQDDETYKAMAKELEKNGLKNIIGCYELTAYGTTTNNMKVSFNLGSNYNGKEVQILHKKKDNTYETFKTTVADGKATITVSEFSPFMIALSDTTNTNNTNKPTNDKKLDDEPKTGVADYTIFASVIALISLGGIVTLKFKK